MIKGYDGIKLYLNRSFAKEDSKAVLVISHGLAVHSGFFDDFTKEANEKNITVYRYDHRGHGRSEGRDTAHIKSYFEMVEDLKIIMDLAKKENPNVPIFLMGHSMGGYISALYGTKYPKETNGIILAAALLRYSQFDLNKLPRPEPADSLVDGWKIINEMLNLTTVSEENNENKEIDPLMLKQFSVSFINNFKDGIYYLKENAKQFTAPVLLINGNDDIYVIPKDAIDFFQEVSSTDKSLRIYNGIGHFIMAEEGGDIMTDDIIIWITRRMRK